MTEPEDLRSANLFPEWGITEHERNLLELYKEAGTVGDAVYTPTKAQRELKGLGYDPSSWERIVKEKIGSHDVRSLAVIALGNHPRILYGIYSNQRAIDYIEGWPPLQNEIGIAPVLNNPTWQTEALKQAIQRANVDKPELKLDSEAEANDNNFSLRPALDSDVEQLALVTEQAWADVNGQPIPGTVLKVHRINDIREYMASPGSWSQVVVEGERIVGFVLGRPAETTDNRLDAAHLRWLMVQPNNKSRGIGSRLLTWASENCKSEGYKRIILWTKEDNDRARALYERHGYTLTGEVQRRPNATSLSLQYELKLH